MNKQTKKPPKFLYRYFPINGSTESIFKDNELWFKNPNEFNDPFDCRPLLTLARDCGTRKNI